MKHLFAAAAIAALCGAVPAGAQVAYGTTPGATATAGFAPGGNWRDAVVIYAETPDSILLDRLVAPIGEETGGISLGAIGGTSFDLRGGSVVQTVVASVTPIAATSPVPEPATWAMMLMGFGAVGGALRSRRKATVRYA